MSAHYNNHFFEDRVDGVDKVTGKARYAADHRIAGLAYGVFVTSTIARGRVTSLDPSKALAAPGVLEVIYYKNCPAVPGYGTPESEKGEELDKVRGFKVLFDNIVRFYGQPIALVVADTFENAVAAVKLVNAQYEAHSFDTDFETSRKDNSKLKPTDSYKRGREKAWADAPVKVQSEYRIPIEVHSPMEMHATTAVWEAEDKLTIYDKTQGPVGVKFGMARMFGIPEKNVRVIAEFVGGAYGNALRSWANVPAACIAAKKLNRPVKVLLNRPQMFTLVGYRPQSWQRVAVGADQNGKLLGISHEAISNTSRYEDFREGIVDVSKFLYACENVDTDYKLLPLDLSTPIWMRGPGEATGCFALESALDDLAYKLKMDPVALRIKNFAAVNPESNKPWSANNLKECYEKGMELIGWAQRPTVPGTLKVKDGTIGYGMGVGVFGASKGTASVRAILQADGSLVLESAVSDMGPGTATAMVNIAATSFQMPPGKIKFRLGDTDFPAGPTQGGSTTTSTLGSAVLMVCEKLQEQLKALAIQYSTALKLHSQDALVVKQEAVVSLKDPQLSISIPSLMQQAGKNAIELTETSKGNNPRDFPYATLSFSVHFVKLHVQANTGVITLQHVVALGDAGKIINEKTARSQMLGGVVGGIGMALTEELTIDHATGKISNASLGSYHLPLHSQIPQIDVWFVNKPDPYINALGAKGLAEISIIGFAAAVSNAVYNATGKRVNDLPITPAKLGFRNS